MGKKKAVSKTNPDALKEAGNKAFGLGSFEEAVKFYTQAIELQANHVYYSNRANAYLSLDMFQNAVDDCDQAIKLEPKFAKAYLRKSNALLNIVRVPEAIECIKTGIAIEPENEEFKKLLEEAEHELKEDTKIPEDNPVKQQFNLMFKGLNENGAKFDKLKLRYYTQDYRGVHAAAPIKNGETVVYIPFDQMLTSMHVKDNEYVQKHSKALMDKFGAGVIDHASLALYILTEWKKPDARFKAYFDTMPKTYDEFPVMFDDKMLDMVKGTNLHKSALQRKEIYTSRYEFLKSLEESFDFTEQECYAVCILV